MRETGGPTIWKVRGRIEIAPDVHIVNEGAATRIEVDSSATLVLGRSTFINWGVDIYVHGYMALGDYVMVGPRCFLSDYEAHQLTPERTVASTPVRIGRNVWLGHSVMVLPGVTIGDHSVIGAGSVVAESLPDRVIAAGSPARVVRSFTCRDDWIRNQFASVPEN